MPTTYAILYQDGTLEIEMLAKNHVQLPVFYEERQEDLYLTSADVFMHKKDVGAVVRVWHQDGEGFKYRRLDGGIEPVSFMPILNAIYAALTHEPSVKQEAGKLARLLA